MKPTTHMFNLVIPEVVRLLPFSSLLVNRPSSVAHSILNDAVTSSPAKLGKVIVVYPMDPNYTAKYPAYNPEEKDFILSDPSNFNLTEMDSRNETGSSEERMMTDENDPSSALTKIYSQNYTDFDEDIMMEDDLSIDISSSGKDKTLERSAIKKWSKEEDRRLLEKVQNIGKKKLYNTNEWKKIAKDFPGQTYMQIKDHYRYLKLTNIEGMQKGKWSTSEERLLNKLILEYGVKPEAFNNADWRKIASQMKSRNWIQIKNHWTHYSNPIVKQFQWTKEIDEIIMKKVQEVGKKWTLIAKSIPGRTAVQIRQHYEDTLDNSVRRSPWTKKEDQLLKAGFEKFGEKWRDVADFINQEMDQETIRTRKQCFNRWQAITTTLLTCKASNDEEG